MQRPTELVQIFCPHCGALAGTIQVLAGTIRPTGVYDPKLLAKSVKEIDWGPRHTRIIHSFQNANITTIEELLRLSLSQVRQIPNIGTACVNDIKEILIPLGLHLGMCL